MAGPDDERLRRVALNESLVREVNERINEGARRFDIRGRTDFLCECANAACSERVRLTLAEYDGVRQHGGRFVVVPGHEIPDAEAVVAREGDHVVVEKIGLGRSVAEERDPRR